MSDFRRLKLERLEERALLAVYTVDFAGRTALSGDLMSFAEAVTAANFTPEADTIEFDPSLAGSVIDLSDPLHPFIDSYTIHIAHDLTIRGLGSDLLTFSPWRVPHTGFNVQSGVENFTISGVTFGKHTFGGNEFYFDRLVNNLSSNLRLEDVVATGLTGQNAIRQGWAGSVTLVDTTLVANSASTQNLFAIDAEYWSAPIHLERTEVLGYRGGVNSGGNIVAVDTTIEARTNPYYGGLVSGGTVELTRSVVNGFRTSQAGGGIRAAMGVTVVDSTISNNTARSGGGIYTEDGPLTIIGSTLENNIATSGRGGGAYKDDLIGAVTIVDSSFINNRAIESNSNGGGLYSTKPVTVSGSRFIGNRTATAGPNWAMYGSAGGAIYSAGQISTVHDTPQTSSIFNSLFEDNSVSGRDSDGGALWISRPLLIESSTFRNNSASGSDGDGGAVHVSGGTIRNSTFVGNRTLGEEGDGGAIVYFGSAAPLVIENSTISGNTTSGFSSDGAGVFIGGSDLDVRSSTIANNLVGHATSVGGGISFGAPASGNSNSGSVTLRNSIVANNTSAGTNPDLYLRYDRITSDYSLIENTAGLTPAQLALIGAGAGNITGQDPLFGPLADNGGSTFTHALHEGSPARDAGDPNFVGPPFVDQRGFGRVSNGRGDMGALEVQVPTRVGDWDGDGDVDGRDFLQWQRGGSPTPLSPIDLEGWQVNYAEEGPGVGGQGAVILLVDEAERFAGTRKTRSGLQVSEVQYFNEVDRAIEQYLPALNSVQSFGVMVARRGVAKRVTIESVSSAFE
jgi:hypothetical protein